MVHPGGRPRTVSLPPEEMIELGKEMLKWVIENQPIHIKQFYSLHKGFLNSEWDTIIKKPEFVPYYEQAMHFISINYLDGTVDKSISQRFLRLYFKDLREEENETKQFESDLKKQEAQAIPEHAEKRMNEIKQEFSNYLTSKSGESKAKQTKDHNE